jgi:hypothetical protein
MKEKRFLHIIGDIDDRHIAEAAPKAKKRFAPAWTKWIAAAACLGLVVGAVLIVPKLERKQPIEPSEDIPISSIKTISPPEEFPVSDKTTAKVRYATDEEVFEAVKTGQWEYLLEYLTEDEMFAKDNMYIFRGVVIELTNYSIDFGSTVEILTVATIDVQKVYKGVISTGRPLSVLLPCAVYPDGWVYMEDTEIISQIKVGMEGVFMTYVCDDNSIYQRGTGTLLKTDLASCGIGDGMRWVFLDTGQGLSFAEFAYPGAAGTKTLDDIEAYVLKMIHSTTPTITTTVVEGTTVKLPDETSAPDTNLSETTVPIDKRANKDEKPSSLLITFIVAGAILIIGAAIYIFYKARKKGS